MDEGKLEFTETELAIIHIMGEKCQLDYDEALAVLEKAQDTEPIEEARNLINMAKRAIPGIQNKIRLKLTKKSILSKPDWDEPSN